MSTSLVYPYTSLKAVRKETKNRDIDKEDWFKECINDASRMVEEFLRRDFRIHDHSLEALQVPTSWVVGDTIFLPYPILSLDAVLINNQEMDTGLWGFQNNDLEKGGSCIVRGAGRYWSDNWELRYFGQEGKPLTRNHSYDTTRMTLALRGVFGYAWPDGTASVSPNIPTRVKRAATLTAAAISRGEPKRGFRSGWKQGISH